MAANGALSPSRSSPDFFVAVHDENIPSTSLDPVGRFRSLSMKHRRKSQSDAGADRPRRAISMTSEVDSEGFESDFVLVTPENAIEAHRMINNYKFGFKKWKSHVTSRPLSKRSDIVKDLYADIGNVRPNQVSTVRPTNLLYVLLFGWWIALLYMVVALLMVVSLVGIPYVPFCWKMSKYFLWPFGKFVYLTNLEVKSVETPVKYEDNAKEDQEVTQLLPQKNQNGSAHNHAENTESHVKEFLTSVRSYPWLILGLPVLMVVHSVVFFITWFFVVTIPIAKVNQKTMTQVLWLPPSRINIGDSTALSMDQKKIGSEIIMYTHQSVNFYYYKYTVDGMNVILVNLLAFVVVSLVMGYADKDNHITNGVTKCVLAVLAIIPLTYYIGMAIISISAQSSFAIGAVLNATFGSIVELLLYVVALVKGSKEDTLCYSELVRSALTGTLVGSILFIPGICMTIGGIKYRSQKFNPKSASVTALLLFVAIGGVFAPTIFSKIFGDLQCTRCEVNSTVSNHTTGLQCTGCTQSLIFGELQCTRCEVNSTVSNHTTGLQCTGCTQSLFGLDGDRSLYEKHVQPLVYACALVLPIAYVIGVVFTLKTHTSYVYDEFYNQMSQDATGGEGQGGHGAPQWSRVKSVIILLLSATLIALCSDLITDNIQELLNQSGVSEYFVGVTMIAMIPELPEVVNGIQFALQNNVNLGIEIGTNTAIQVCLIQVPALVLINLIYPLDFTLVFNDIHLWAVIFSVIVINYIFQDGKSDYFQGSALVAIYLLLLCMYFFVPPPDISRC